MYRKIGISLLIISLLSLSSPLPTARAMSSDVRSVLLMGFYGILGGTAMGLLSYPLTHDRRTVFMGTSMGLYMGLGVGIYHISHRDDLSNPLASNDRMVGLRLPVMHF